MKSKLRSKLVTARPELRKGFAVPTKQRIFAALRKIKSKVFILELLWFAFSKLNRTDKIKILMKIDRRVSIKSTGKTKRKAKRKTRKSKTKKRKASKRKASGRKKPRTAKQRAATRKLIAFNKRRRR